METFKFLMTSTFYPPYHLGGDAVFVKYLAEELAARGHEVHVLSCLDTYQLKTRKRLNKTESNSGVIVHNLKSPFGILSPLSAYILGSSSYYTKIFSDLVHEINPDIVHHHNVSLLGHPILERKADYLSIHTTHDFWLICPTYGLINNKGELCLKKRCTFCTLAQKKFPQLWRQSNSFKSEIQNLDLIISPSEFFKCTLQKHLKNRVVCIPNFSTRPPQKADETDYSDFFLYAGVLEKGKGLAGLVNLVKEDDVHIKLLVAGNGSLKSEVEKTIKRYGLENKIKLLGWVDHGRMYDLMHNANALIVPSTCLENSPLISLEALSVGTPVISSNNGGLPEIVGKISQKLIFDNWSELREILCTFSRKDFPSEVIKKVYEDNFSPESHVSKYLEVIDECQSFS